MRVEIADLGDWGLDDLFSEYDPEGPVIRVNRRVVERLEPGEAARFVACAIAHELYHVREHRGEIPLLRSRAARELAAQAYARRATGT